MSDLSPQSGSKRTLDQVAVSDLMSTRPSVGLRAEKKSPGIARGLNNHLLSTNFFV
jgi:hypothetical protein